MQKKNRPLGYYSRVEWLYPGGYLEQPKKIVDIFTIIKDEEARMHGGH